MAVVAAVQAGRVVETFGAAALGQRVRFGRVASAGRVEVWMARDERGGLLCLLMAAEAARRFCPLKDHVALEQHRATTFQGLLTRLMTKRAALTLRAVWLRAGLDLD